MSTVTRRDFLRGTASLAALAGVEMMTSNGQAAQAQTQPAPTAIARNQGSAPTAAFITSSRNGGTWVGANHYEGGANN